jgi:hypothetical protein
MSKRKTNQAAKIIANATQNTKSAPQLAPLVDNNIRLGSANPRSRRSTTPRNRRTTPRRSKTLSPVAKNKPKRASDTSFLDRLAKRTAKARRPRTAGPIVCSASGRWSRPGGGKFSTAKPKTETDWIIKRSKETPGPGQYSPKYVRKNRAVMISDANPKSEVDLIMLRSKETPGPSEYQPKAIGRKKGLKISDARPKSELDWIIHRSISTPG